ncbi:MAG: DUF1232 domain-containing protein [Chloroflexota bacterium]
MSDKNLTTNSQGGIPVLAGLINQLRLVWLLMQDNRVSNWVKAVLPASILYLVSPVDFIPDVILGAGQLDDLGVILLGLTLFVKLCPPDIVQFYRDQIEFGETDDREAIDTSYRVIDEE